MSEAKLLPPTTLDESTSDTAPRKIESVSFGMLSGTEITKLSQIEVVNKEIYPPNDQTPTRFGVLDRRLGVCTGSQGGVPLKCETCNLPVADCIGHFGHIRLALPCFHIGYVKAILLVLQCICKSCSRLLLPEADRLPALSKLRNPRLDPHRRLKLLKTLVDKCKKGKKCHNCQADNGTTKRVLQRIRHESTQEDINPLRAMQLFEAMTAEDVELMGMDPVKGRPERMIMTRVLVPPVCIRPSVRMDATGTNEDDATVKLSAIVLLNSHLEYKLKAGARFSEVMDVWDALQMECAVYINSEVSGYQIQGKQGGGGSKSDKPHRGLCQRLKGKQGRFRGNLSGKRVDFSGRTVISPDPNLRVTQVGLPEQVARILTYPERVTMYNLEHMKTLIRNGPHLNPGANHIIDPATGFKSDLRYVDLRKTADKLRVGQIVERHVHDGDVVLFNRQPSLHKMSIMCHQVRVMPWRTFRFNECVCAPYNADFDGDEMNIHVPQTEEARAEALTLMGVANNIITPRNGEPLISATQDFLTASYLITRRDVFLERDQFAMLCSYMFDGKEKIELPPPAICKPLQLWTGKQLFKMLLCPNRKSQLIVNLELKEKNVYTAKEYMCPNDGYVFFHNSELVSGTLGKLSLGGGSKGSLFFTLIKQYSSADAAECMWRLAKLCARWLGTRGFSIGIADVQPHPELVVRKEAMIGAGYSECDKYISEFRAGTLERQAGFSVDETLEAKVSGRLSQIRDQAGVLCMQQLPWHNAPLVMATCGSKGSTINLCQMIACVGQQTVSGNRIADGFVKRTLPHFERDSRIPAAKGFVQNSFYTGMTATEFFFHTMGGREGLVDTAVKTAETGYMQRRLMKALEDLSVQYDNTVRNSVGGILQFTYGDDGLDPARMEASNSRPIEFGALLAHVIARTPADPMAEFLTGRQISEELQKTLTQDQFTKSCTDTFLNDLRTFLTDVSDAVGKTRVKQGELKAAEPDAALAVDHERRRVVDRVNGVTLAQLRRFLAECLVKYNTARVQPGEAVGAVGAQSIGEPGTQMTLKTFHFAGVASMNVTLGVPRIREIINASKTISTPIISAKLDVAAEEISARVVKGRVERTFLGEIASKIKEVYTSTEAYLSVALDEVVIKKLMLEITAESVRQSILGSVKKIKENNVTVTKPYHLKIFPLDNEPTTMYFSLQSLKEALLKVVVVGIPTVGRAVITKYKSKKHSKNHFMLQVEGLGLRDVMTRRGVKGRKTESNHIMECMSVLGIEAARTKIIKEIGGTFSSHGMSIDSRHVMLLADLMTYRGEILGITRFGLQRMKDSVFLLASFEKTTDHLFDAAVHHKVDKITGVSECIIMGAPVPVGTGLFTLLQKVEKPVLAPRTLLVDTKRFKLDVAQLASMEM